MKNYGLRDDPKDVINKDDLPKVTWPGDSDPGLVILGDDFIQKGLGKKILGINDANYVNVKNEQNITGAKTFFDAKINKEPVEDLDIVNKKYVDENAGGTDFNKPIETVRIIQKESNNVNYLNPISSTGTTLSIYESAILTNGVVNQLQNYPVNLLKIEQTNEDISSNPTWVELPMTDQQKQLLVNGDQDADIQIPSNTYNNIAITIQASNNLSIQAQCETLLARINSGSHRVSAKQIQMAHKEYDGTITWLEPIILNDNDITTIYTNIDMTITHKPLILSATGSQSSIYIIRIIFYVMWNMMEFSPLKINKIQYYGASLKTSPYSNHNISYEGVDEFNKLRVKETPVNDNDVINKKYLDANLFSLPYGSVVSIPKQTPTPEGFAEFGTELKAVDYPHLVDLFGTTNIILQDVDINLASNNSSSDFYIDTDTISLTNTVDQADDVYKMFGSQGEGFVLGDGTNETLNYKNVSFNVKGKFIDDWMSEFTEGSLYQVTTTVTQSNNNASYPEGISVLNIDFKNISTSSQQDMTQIAPGETITSTFVRTYRINPFVIDEKLFSAFLGGSNANTLIIKNVMFKMPVKQEDLYIKLPDEWIPGISILNAITSKLSKLVMYVGKNVNA